MPRLLSEDEFNQVKTAVLKGLPDNLSEAEFNRQIGPRMEQALGTAENVPPQVMGSVLGRFASGVWSSLSPFQAIGGAAQAIMHPVATAQAIGSASAHHASEALKAAQAGRYVEALGHAAGSVPILGTVPADIGERMAETGDIATGLGQATGLVAGPRAMQAGGRVVRQTVGPALGKVAEVATRPEVAKQVVKYGTGAVGAGIGGKLGGTPGAVMGGILGRELGEDVAENWFRKPPATVTPTEAPATGGLSAGERSKLTRQGYAPEAIDRIEQADRAQRAGQPPPVAREAKKPAVTHPETPASAAPAESPIPDAIRQYFPGSQSSLEMATKLKARAAKGDKALAWMLDLTPEEIVARKGW